MNTYEAKVLLRQSLICLAMSMEQIRLRETEKCIGYDEPMQDHLAQCTSTKVPYEMSSVEDCCEYLNRLYKGFEEASNHEIQMEKKFMMADFDVAHICDMVMGYIGHDFPEDLVECAREINNVADELLPPFSKHIQNDKGCKKLLGSFLKKADEIIKRHHLQTWKDGEYSLPLGYLHDWMRRRYWEEQS